MTFEIPFHSLTITLISSLRVDLAGGSTCCKESKVFIENMVYMAHSLDSRDLLYWDIIHIQYTQPFNGVPHSHSSGCAFAVFTQQTLNNSMTPLFHSLFWTSPFPRPIWTRNKAASLLFSGWTQIQGQSKCQLDSCLLSIERCVACFLAVLWPK